jgi:hypothetical protein
MVSSSVAVGRDVVSESVSGGVDVLEVPPPYRPTALPSSARGTLAVS